MPPTIAAIGESVATAPIASCLTTDARAASSSSATLASASAAALSWFARARTSSAAAASAGGGRPAVGGAVRIEGAEGEVEEAGASEARVGGGGAHHGEERLGEGGGRACHLRLVDLPQLARRVEEVVERLERERLRLAHLGDQPARPVVVEGGAGRQRQREALLALRAVLDLERGAAVELRLRIVAPPSSSEKVTWSPSSRSNASSSTHCTRREWRRRDGGGGGGGGGGGSGGPSPARAAWRRRCPRPRR